MKASEAPKRVYLHLTTGDCILNGKYYEYKPAKIRYDDKIIEYIRTDVFIEKACDWLEPVLKNYAGYYVGEDILRDFKNYMKEE